MAAGRLAALALLLAVCLPLHLVTRLFGRSNWPRRFLAAAARLCGAKVRIAGRTLQPHTLLICNHVSWLDIPVLAGATGCAFVSKNELGHGLLHWLADQNDTLYVRRDHRGGAANQAEAIARKLRQAKPLALFPEGTTGPGTDLLPFRPALFSAVAPPPEGVEVRPVAIDYGEWAPRLGWHEETGIENLLRTLGRWKNIEVTVRLLDPLPPMTDRKALARAASEAITDALASSRAGQRLYAAA
ncbi:MAG TPA: lysophospholipid acyltransferase family protein [Sphingomicrobium sp.]|nr:lysophospholipid acyltransferase family protein [Sphingomicrobium sp.]